MSSTDQQLAVRPASIGLAASFGFGDRLGLATPGHVAALRMTGSQVVPVFAQQSWRELVRTGRTFDEVLRCAVDGAKAVGWSAPFGADADHLKEVAQVREAVAAGYTMFTLDPSDHVGAVADAHAEVAQQFRALPWHDLEDRPDALLARYRSRIELETMRLVCSEDEVEQAAVKYLRAVLHAARLSAAVPEGADIEVSVDETPLPTSAFEHVFVVCELKRRGVELTSLAPRFPGTFEKGIGYVGSLDEFATATRVHVAVQDAYGPYKLSLHSGSDKLSLYRLFAELTRGRFHIKTAGTSYLEALRTVGALDPELLVEIWTLACDRYAEDRATYELSAEVADVAPDLAERRPVALLDDRSARRVLHVTYGSILSDDVLASRLRTALQTDGGHFYEQALARHLGAHVAELS